MTPTSKSRPSGDLLYHYTTQEGLLGIIDKRCIWASHIRYLNDLTEGREIFKFFDAIHSVSKTLRTLRTKESDTAFLSKSKAIFQDFKSLISSNGIYATSFSRNGDLLSQWRAYGGQRGGYSIGFSDTWLRDIGIKFLSDNAGQFHDDNEPLIRCSYVSGKGRSLTLADTSGPTEKKTMGMQGATPFTPDISTDKGIESLILTLLRNAASPKNSSFSEEAEWRLAFYPRENVVPDAVSFRAGTSMLTPYLEIPFGPKSRSIGIEKIIVGPCPHRDEAIQSVKMLLEKKAIRGVKLEASSVPYRYW